MAIDQEEWEVLKDGIRKWVRLEFTDDQFVAFLRSHAWNDPINARVAAIFLEQQRNG